MKSLPGACFLHTRFFWRTLGYVINQSKFNYNNSLQKAKDYHAALSKILEGLAKLQQSGVEWKLPYNGKVHDVNLKLPILFIIGDTEGHDKLAGRYLSRNKKVKQMCCYCDCPSTQRGNPNFEFKYVNQKVID